MSVTAKQVERVNDEYQALINASLSLDKKEVKDRPVTGYGWRLLKTPSDVPYLKFSCPDCRHEALFPMPTSGNGLTLERFTFRHCRKAEIPPTEMLETFCRITKKFVMAHSDLTAAPGDVDPTRGGSVGHSQPVPIPPI